MSTLFDRLQARARRHPQRGALLDRARGWSYGELAERARGLASALLARGVQPGDRVGLCLDNRLEWAAAALGVLGAGAVLVPLHPAWTAPQRAHALGHAGARLLLGAAPWRVDELDFIDVTENTPRATRGRLPEVRGPDLAALFYTSGSTGLPKGVMHSHDALLGCAQAIAHTLGVRPQDRLLAQLPLAFHYGFSQLSQAWCVGAAVAFPSATLPGPLVEELAALEVSVLASVPFGWSGLVEVLEERPSPLRLATNAGGALRPATLARLRAALPKAELSLMYGFTECLRSATLPARLLPTKPGAMGLPMPGVQLAVVDAQGRALGPGEVGELIHGGAFTGMGYWRDPEASAARFGPQAALGGARGARSGDLAHVDEDGVYWFHARADGVLKIAGHRVGPGEIEAQVLGSGLVGEVAALGVEDPRAGQVLGLVVTPRPGMTLEPAALRRWCRQSLPGWMQPKALRVVPALPRTATGKPDRAALAQVLASHAG